VARRGENLIEGKIQHRGHFGFLISEKEGGKDIYISGPTLKLAMDGDRVAARITGNRGGKIAGEIVRVITRGRTTMVGALRRAGKFWALIPEGGLESDALEVTGADKGVTLAEGQIAALRIERWPTEQRTAGGVVFEILGSPDDPKTRVKAVVASKDIPTEFPEDALAEAAALPNDPEPSSWAGRKELFDLPTVTIDGADAKDFDDAVSLEDLGGGKLRLGVHIADVANYVKRDSPIDKEAVRRGTSVYLPGRVIPMLPPKLSDHLCSLRPDVPRLTLTCWMDMTADGAVHGAKVEETVIRSWRRFTYEEVQDVLDGKPVERVVPEVLAAVKRMGPLAKALTAWRMKRGALDFNTSEYQVKCSVDGTPIEVVKRARLDSHRLVEEFMVAANEAVARHLSKARVPFLRRLHDVPDPERLEMLQKELGQLGIRAQTSLVANPVKGLQSLLKAAIGHPFEETANIQVIRSLKLAVYSPEPGGHFGLASTDYCHFTSPIRRYPDLFVHRALKAGFAGKPRAHADGLSVQGLATRCSERERGAAETERKAVDLARAQLLGRSVGQEFIGVVVNSTTAGLFIALPESGAVGLLRSGGGTIGMKIKVRLKSVDAAAGRLDFEAVKDELPGQVRTTPWRRNPKKRR
jgi:ribonuclease R